MNKTEIQNALNGLNALLLEGKTMEAFEKYYHEDVQMQENDLLPVISKELNRVREREFLDNVVEMRRAEILGVSIGENLSSVMWHYNYTHKEWGIRNYTQVSVQQWKDGRIIKEVFIYHN